MTGTQPQAPQKPERPPRRRGRFGRFVRGYLMIVGAGFTIYYVILGLAQLFALIARWTGTPAAAMNPAAMLPAWHL